MSEKKEYMRELAAGQVVSKMRRIARIWEELDYFTENGRVMPEKGLTLQMVIAELSVPEIVRLCFDLPPLISRWKAKLKTMPEGAKREQLKINLALKEAELQAIKQLRDEPV